MFWYGPYKEKEGFGYWYVSDYIHISIFLLRFQHSDQELGSKYLLRDYNITNSDLEVLLR